MSTLEHAENSSPLAEHSTYHPDPEAPVDVLPPPGPHVQQVRGVPGVGTTKAKSAEKAE